MHKYQRLTDEQWAILEPLPASEASSVRGRPPVRDDRPVPNGILWLLRTGAAWADLPERFPSSSTCCRRFGKWGKTGVFRNIPEALARDPEERGATNLSECFIDGTFVVAKKGAQKWERPGGARVRGSWLSQTLPVFRSPCTRILPALMRSPLSKLPYSLLKAQYAQERDANAHNMRSLMQQQRNLRDELEEYREFTLQPEIMPLHAAFLQEKEEQRQREEEEQQERERQEEEARQQAERARHIRQEPETAPQRRRSRMR